MLGRPASWRRACKNIPSLLSYFLYSTSYFKQWKAIQFEITGILILNLITFNTRTWGMISMRQAVAMMGACVCFCMYAHGEWRLEKYILLCQTSSSCIEDFSTYYGAQAIKLASDSYTILMTTLLMTILIQAYVGILPLLKKNFIRSNVKGIQKIQWVAFLLHILELHSFH